MPRRPLRDATWLLMAASITSLASGQVPRTKPSEISIASVTPIASQAAQTITIKGHGFGIHASYIAQDTPYLSIRDKTARWAAGRVIRGNVDTVKLSVARWTDREIVLTGFDGAYGRRNWRLHDGDRLEVAVWNAQTGAGPATFDLTVGTGQGTATGTAPPSRGNKQDNRNGLTAGSGVHVPDDVIVQNISNSLLTDSALKTREILVTAQNGVVTLAGTVNSQLEREAAERIANSEEGVRRVINQLAISAR